jgi:hypothetical protein
MLTWERKIPVARFADRSGVAPEHFETLSARLALRCRSRATVPILRPLKAIHHGEGP